ncbi:MAG: hypothetical protein GXO17_01710 [Thermodesulfobacteria bacterium]|nr:hypothetical protein [Thermodesulfobacteriota bacterium]
MFLFYSLFPLGTGRAGTLVTIETQKARLTLSLLERFVRLEDHLRHRRIYRVLALLPKVHTAFQDQRLVNETVLEFFRRRPNFVLTVVSDGRQALRALREGNYDILYIAGLVPEIELILKEAAERGVLTVSHLTELVPEGLALSLDLGRRRACILANERTWQVLSLRLPAKIARKICFVSTDQ